MEIASLPSCEFGTAESHILAAERLGRQNISLGRRKERKGKERKEKKRKQKKKRKEKRKKNRLSPA